MPQTLDLTAIRLVLESFQLPSGEQWKDLSCRQKWLSRIQTAKPLIENIVNAALAGSTADVYTDMSLNIVDGLRYY